MKTLQHLSRVFRLLVAVAVLTVAARGADRWERFPGGVPGWVLPTLTFKFTHGEPGTAADYQVTMPDPCSRLVLGNPARSGREIIFEAWMESLTGVGCAQVVSTQTGRFELGSLSPGDWTLVVRTEGGAVATFAFKVPDAEVDTLAAERPAITAVQVEKQEVVVTVAVPAGVRKVTLESRTRLGSGTWTPRAVNRLTGDGGTLAFRIEKSEVVEVLRVRGDSREALPARLYQGPSEFNGQSTQGTAANSPANSWRNLDFGGPPEANAGGGARDVVESDIWAIRGDTLYFFNQYRGLQVVDLTEPDQPVISGTLKIPAAGEQMYVLGNQHAVLLARNGCNWSADEGSQAIVVDVSGATPTIAASLPVPGYIQESRLVGTALYVASQTYRVVTMPPREPGGSASEQWEYGTVVSSFDLSDPAAPRAKETLWYPGYGNVVAATDRFLFIGLQYRNDWWRSEVQLIDISSPDGVMKPTAAIIPAGRIADKFKLNLDGDVFTVISHVWRWENRNESVSVLETFSLTDPMAPRKLGEIRVGKGEALFATRFDGDRAYIVTFEQIDPLWIVDLRDPANPKLHGELEVPGWSTYIQPLGDRLVTVGIAGGTSWQVAVSLFDVKDPARPALLSKVPLGENSSWSEANHDEKAFTVLPEAGLILVPYQGYAENGYASRVQLIDLGADALKARGFIEHAMQPRRATVHGERVLSLSGRELLTVNATDRDHPQVTGATDLAWPVDDVVAANGHLVQIERGQAWWGGTTPTVRVATEAAPDRPLGSLTLPRPHPIAGSHQSGGFLYLAQFDAASAWEDPVKDGEPPAPKPPNFFLTVLDLGALPELKVVGSTEARVESPGWISELQAFVPRLGVLVWSSAGSGWWRGPWGWDIAPVGRWLPWWGGSGGQFFAFDIRDPLAPHFASFTQLATDGEFWGFSRTFLANGLLYNSHQKSEFIPDPNVPDTTPPDQSRGRWVTRYFLSVLDFADPTTPAVRKPVSIPGQLEAVSHNGEVIYTTGYHWDASGQTDWTQFLDALAYDGVEASLVVSQKLGDGWSGLMGTVADQLILGRYDAAKQATRLETWQLTEQGALVQVGLTERAGYPSQLATLEDLVLLGSGAEITVWGAANPANLQLIGRSDTDGCVYPSLRSGIARTGSRLWLPLGDYGLMELELAP